MVFFRALLGVTVRKAGLLRRRGPSTPAPAGAGAVSPFPERRRWPRRWGDPVMVRIAGEAYGPAPPQEGWVMNRAEGGVGISLPAPVSPGTRLYLAPFGMSAGVAPVEAEVVHCTARAARWVAGCAFHQAVPAEVMLLFR